MFFDVPDRYETALNSVELADIPSAVIALVQSLEDCRNAGVDPNSDPAVVLLARHLPTVARNSAGAEVLRHACQRRLAEVRRFPALRSFALHGVAYDQAAKSRFHADAKHALLRVAHALRLPVGSFTITSEMGPPDRSGYVLLGADRFGVAVRVGGPNEGREVVYRTVDELPRTQNRFAAIAELLKPAAFAERLTRELSLGLPACAATTPASLDS